MKLGWGGINGFARWWLITIQVNRTEVGQKHSNSDQSRTTLA